ncbi:YqgE/AlgH family protein [Phycicoccus sp. M110.8]|uniref:YqgE/AlgH family protein n=1 Tax=Phycicoccus sp. M110.8 TaxID=3075433 RepID=UPI0028FD243A|nr:YqgE/AlgH family protein [Phycicoccus sp. M110.8]MDU0312524.1 YqgE/AlgH family protein [Phycicoccus sp. M110.8]
METEDLSGSLLLATPQIEEGVFRRSVVLLLHHDAEGAQGVVLNRPLDARVDAVLPEWQDHVTAPRVLFEGGPVGLDSALGLVTAPGDVEPMGVKRLFGGVGLVDLDTPPELVMPEVAGMRIFAGYAGWSPGQLEDEVDSGSWYVVEAEGRDAFDDDPQSLWVRVLRRQRDHLAFVATFPVDPEMN